MMSPMNGGASLEVRLIGNEGMLGITLMLGIDVATSQFATASDWKQLLANAIRPIKKPTNVS